jgi:glycosyltransferase involved in cell wall biosynthesis
MGRDHSVCVVTHPISHASEAAVDGLLEVISAEASVSLITANLPDDSVVWEEYEVTKVSDTGTGDSVVVAAWRFLRNQIRMCQAIRRRDEKIVLFFGAMSYLLPILFARAIGKQVILEPRGNVPDSLHRIWAERMPDQIAYLLSRGVWALERVGYASADAILTLSPGMAEDLELGRYENKLHKHGARPVDIERFRLETPYENRERRIGYLGRLDEEKGVDILIDVVARLPDDVTFVFIGDGALREQIERELADEIERGTVEVTGWVDHQAVPARLNELQLLVMTSRTEGVPTTALEAMACGTPVCATPVGGIPDVVRDGETGKLLDSNSAARMASQIATLLNDEEARVGMSKGAREFVVENYSFDAVVERYRTVFEDVTTESESSESRQKSDSRDES